MLNNFITSMITVQIFVFNPWQENTYLIYDDTNECVIIDAGCFFENEDQILLDFIAKNKLTVKHVVNTHLHIDHIFGNAMLYKTFNLTPKAHREDIFLIEESCAIANRMEFDMPNRPPTPTEFLDETKEIKCGKFKLKILHVPGHTPGHLVYYLEEENALFTGDVLFYHSIGRSDFPYGNCEQLVTGIKHKLLTLPEKTKVYPGHGECSTIGNEKKGNPFL
jgi:glyoxylase-like metal-dependent hydrolase (beta-lactamase superfamily II)